MRYTKQGRQHQSNNRQGNKVRLGNEIVQAITGLGVKLVPTEIYPLPGNLTVKPERVSVRLPGLAKTGYAHLTNTELFTRVFAVCQDHQGATRVVELEQAAAYEKGRGRQYNIEVLSVSEQLDNLVYNLGLKPVRLISFSRIVAPDGWLAHRWYAAEPPAELQRKRPENGAGCRRDKKAAA